VASSRKRSREIEVSQPPRRGQAGEPGQAGLAAGHGRPRRVVPLAITGCLGGELGQQHPGRRMDLQAVGPQPVPELQLHTHQTRWHRIVVAAEGHRGVGAHRRHNLDLGRVRNRWQGQQSLCLRQLGHRRPGRPSAIPRRVDQLPRRPQPVVGDGGAEVVEAHLSGRRVGSGHGPLPSPAREAHRAFHHPLPVPAPRGTWRHDRAIVPGHLGEAGLHIAGSGHDHGRQPVRSPHPGSAPQTAQHRIHRLDQVGLVQVLRQHAPPPLSPRTKACPAGCWPSRPTGPAGGTSPTGSPRPADGRSRCTPAPSPRRTPHCAVAAPPAAAAGQSSGSCPGTPVGPPRRTGRCPRCGRCR
jgi:hypothetical protein